MGAQRKTHRVLDSGGRGEVPRAADRGAEPLAANPESESPSAYDRLIEEVCERENLKQALKRVKANKGAPGVVGMTVLPPGGSYHVKSASQPAGVAAD